MSDDGTCDTCGRPLPTQRDADEIAPGKGEEWCWRAYQGGVCLGEPVDWRQRFLAEAEARVAAEGACDCAEAEVARLREQVAEERATAAIFRDLLGKVVASWCKGADTCPVCGQDPCAPSCRLAAALKEKDHG